MKYLLILIVILSIFLNTLKSDAPQCLAKVKIDSAGFNVGNYLKMFLNGELITDLNYSRGITLAVINEQTGEYINGGTYDTWGDCSSVSKLINFIDQIDENRIVLTGVRDEGSKCLNDKAYEALQTIGLSSDYKLQFRESFAMIGKKGGKNHQGFGSSVKSSVQIEKCIVNKCSDEIIGNVCKPLEWLQNCAAKIDELVNNSEVEKSWKISINQKGVVQHHFQFQYSENFHFDEDCFEQRIVIGSQQQQTLLKKEYKFDAKKNILSFQKNHQWVKNLGNFSFDEEKFFWAIEMQLEIFMAGIEQHTFKMHLTKSLFKEQQHQDITHELHANGEIETEIKFCLDLNCEKFKPEDGQLLYHRDQDIYFQVSIISEDYKYLHLNPVSQKIGALSCELISFDDSQPGVTLYHIRTQMAQENTVLKVVHELFNQMNNETLAKKIIQQEGMDYDIVVKERITTIHPISIVESEISDQN